MLTLSTSSMASSAPSLTSSDIVSTDQNHWSLYVGDLDHSIIEPHLHNLFNQVGSVTSIKVCRDLTRGFSFGYAYVNFGNPRDAAKALELLNFTPLNGKPIRIMYSQRDPSIRLYDTFATFGTILSCKVAVDSYGNSKGHGFVQFDTQESAQKAISSLNGMLINDKKVYVGGFLHRQQRSGASKFTNVYIKNLSENFTAEDLKNVFEEYGAITSAVVMKDANGKSKGFGFVNFQEPDAAATAVEKLNGSEHGESVWYVGRAQKKAERVTELRAKFEQERLDRYQKFQGSNLYLKNLDSSFNDEKLKEVFSEFGTMTSCKVMLDAQGNSKGCGFVAFSTAEEATKASASSSINESNSSQSSTIFSKYSATVNSPCFILHICPLSAKILGLLEPEYLPWRLTHAVCASFDLSMLPTMDFETEQINQDITVSLHLFHLASCWTSSGFELNGKMVGKKPLYVAVAERKEDRKARLMPKISSNTHQQMYYGRGGPGFFIPPSSPGYGLPHQFMAGAGHAISPTFISPYQHQRLAQAGVRINNLPEDRGAAAYAGNAQNGFVSSAELQGVLGPVPPVRVPLSALASALAASPPEKHKPLLGDAGKVTGMLLEMDQPEVLHLMESPEALRSKVGEAMEVLRASGSVTSEKSNSTSAQNINTIASLSFHHHDVFIFLAPYEHRT
uniref:Polyadenylate-binding protein n=1 Tax=Kalanchoe fedtschenkoi TaxID=63787 RepID=A0A7N0VL16_KALFE